MCMYVLILCARVVTLTQPCYLIPSPRTSSFLAGLSDAASPSLSLSFCPPVQAISFIHALLSACILTAHSGMTVPDC